MRVVIKMRNLLILLISLIITGCATVSNDLRTCTKACSTGQVKLFKDLEITCVCKESQKEDELEAKNDL